MEKSHEQCYKEEFRRLRSLTKLQIKEPYNQYIHNSENSIKTDAAAFWSFVNQKSRTSRIPGTMSFGSTNYSEPQKVVDAFAQFFESVYLLSDPSHETNTTYDSNSSHVDLIRQPIMEDEIYGAAKKLKNKMTSGPDKIPSFLVKDCVPAFIKGLQIIFNLILKSKTFPGRWKETRVCPIFKSGNRCSVENYRSISILNNFGKLLEIILYNRIYACTCSYISEFQHGFMNRRSTITNLGIFTQLVSADNQGQLDAVYTAFTKAFDRLEILTWIIVSNLLDIMVISHVLTLQPPKYHRDLIWALCYSCCS
nr:unnamed protein product [Callosobruchus analis]